MQAGQSRLRRNAKIASASSEMSALERALDVVHPQPLL